MYAVASGVRVDAADHFVARIEHGERESFPIDEVIGCVYVYPARDGVHDASVQSLVREADAALNDTFRRAIADWLTSDAWPFERPLYAPLLT